MNGRMFDFEGPLARLLNVVANLIILNLLTVVCIIPIITFGPAVKALYAACLKMARGEDGYIIREYFKQFRMNFGQTVGLGLIVLVADLIFVGDIWTLIVAGPAFPTIIKIGMVIAGIIVLAVSLWVFPMQSRFTNPISRTFALSLWLAFKNLPKTGLMLIYWAFLPACVLFLPFISTYFEPVVLILELSFAAYLSALTYDFTFRDMEDVIRKAQNKQDEEKEN